MLSVVTIHPILTEGPATRTAARALPFLCLTSFGGFRLMSPLGCAPLAVTRESLDIIGFEKSGPLGCLGRNAQDTTIRQNYHGLARHS
jgi:hypothetical protein